MTFNVILQPRAEADVERVTSWLARKKGHLAAAQWRAGVLNFVVEKLEYDPRRYPEADEALEFGIDLRMMLYRRWRHVYRVLFVVEGNDVNVLRICHASQDRLQADEI